MKKLACVGIGLAFLLVLVLATGSSGAAQDKAKYTIKEVMKKAHQSKLYAKVGKGEASDAEEKELVELYIALHANKPPKGDEKAFKEKTEKMLALAKAAEKGDKEAGAKLLKEVNCKACHDAFRP